MFLIQIGHPSVRKAQDQQFSSLAEIFSYIFQPSSLSFIIYWQSIPLTFHYGKDIEANFDRILGLLWLMRKEKRGATKLELINPLLFIQWKVFWTESDVRMEARFTDREDGYEAYADALNQNEEINLDRAIFTREWKSLLNQLVVAVGMSEANLPGGKAQKQWEALKKLEAEIKRFGKLYIKEENSDKF